jgi:hypothetical protein
MRELRRLIFNLALILILAKAGYSQGGYQIPKVEATKVITPPTINGVLDEPCWQELPKLTGFWCPEFDKEPSEKTEVFLGYDQENIYVGFYCFDTQPEKIVATETKRGGNLRNDDRVSVSFDTFHQHRWGENYQFTVSALGTQNEEIPGGGAAKTEWRGDWQAAAKVIKDGWQAEMKIPLAILKYPPGQTTFGLSFSRFLARRREESSWPNMGKSWDMTKTGDWEGLKLPALKNPVILMPYMMLLRENGRISLNSGLDLKHTMPSGLTICSTYKPDNRSIEGAILDLSFSYTERMLPDNRPFFAEGGEGFRGGFFPPASVFYSRRIEDFDWGLKAFGHLGKNTLGLLSTGEMGGALNIASKWEHHFSQNLSLTGVAVSHRLDDEDNLLTGLSAQYSKPLEEGGWLFSGISLYKSQEDAGSGSSSSINLGCWPGNGRIGGNLNYLSITPSYNPALGFVPETDIKGYSGGLNYHLTKDEGWLEELGWDVYFGDYQHQDNSPFHRDLAAGTELDIRDSFGLGLGFFATDRYEDTDFFQDRVISLGARWNRYNLRRRGRLSLDLGKQAGADYKRLSLSQGFQAGERFAFQLGTDLRLMDYPEYSERASQIITTLNYDITPEKGLGGRLVMADGKLSGYLAYHQMPRKGMDFLVIFGDPNSTTFQPSLIIKVVRVFSVVP